LEAWHFGQDKQRLHSLDLAEDFNFSRDVPYSPLTYGPNQAQYFFFPRPFSNVVLAEPIIGKRSSNIYSIPLRRAEIKLGKDLVRKTSDKLLALLPVSRFSLRANISILTLINIPNRLSSDFFQICFGSMRGCARLGCSAREEETAQPLSGIGHLLFAEVSLAPGFLGRGESDENRTSFL